MRTLLLLSCISLLALGRGTPAVADEPLVNGKHCNAACRSWLDLPPLQGEPVTQKPIMRPAPAPVVAAVAPRPEPRREDVRTTLPVIEAPRPMPLAQSPDSGEQRPAPVTVVRVPPNDEHDEIGAPAPEEASPAVEAKVRVERVVRSEEATTIIGNPRWDSYVKTVFPYKGSLFPEAYDRQHRVAPSVALASRAAAR